MLCASQSWVAHAFASCIRAGDLLEYVCSTLAVTVSVVVTSGIPGGLGGTSGADGGCVGSWLSRSLAVAVFGSRDPYVSDGFMYRPDGVDVKLVSCDRGGGRI